MFLWVHFDRCPEALRPGSACINQYLLLLIIKNKATPCLEHTSLGFLLAPWMADSVPGLGERKAQSFLPGALGSGDGGWWAAAGSSLRKLKRERLGTELLSSLAPAGSKAAGVDLATAQEAIAAFPASV